MIPVSPLPVPRARPGRAVRTMGALLAATVWVAALARQALPHSRAGRLR